MVHYSFLRIAPTQNSGSNPVLIALPPELAGMSLEMRLVTYDWRNQFDAFQQVTQHGSFKAICWDAKNALMPVGITICITLPWFSNNLLVHLYICVCVYVLQLI